MDLGSISAAAPADRSQQTLAPVCERVGRHLQYGDPCERHPRREQLLDLDHVRTEILVGSTLVPLASPVAACLRVEPPAP